MSNPQSTAQSDRAAGPIDADEPTPSDAAVIETTPALKPTLIGLTALLVVGVATIGYLVTSPDLLGSPERTEVAANLVGLLLLVGVGRLVLRLYVLTRTRYVVTADAVRREYSLLYKEFSRELPIAKLRSHELRQNRLETLLGIGTVGFLTGTATRSPAHLEFEHVPDPERIRRRVRARLDETE